MVGLGMEGKRLKIVLHVKEGRTDNMDSIAIYEIFKGFMRKKENSATSVSS